MLRKETIDLVKNTLSIVDIVGLYVDLKKKGRSYMACCPFHNENTPSFSVSPKNNIFKCFGCGESGDAIKFIEKIENVDFIEAVKVIAKHYGIQIIEVDNDKELTEEQKKVKEGKEILKHAQSFFSKNLQNSQEAYAYLHDRNINQESIEKFLLGYSEVAYDKWKSYADGLGLSQNLQLQLGLLSDNNGTLYDRFRKRIIFPICNNVGEVLGFAGRVYTPEQNQAKYINSQDSFLYHKSSIIYGLHLAKQTIREEDKCFLVEGYFDVIMMHQIGIHNTVSSCGTSLTDGQAK